MLEYTEKQRTPIINVIKKVAAGYQKNTKPDRADIKKNSPELPCK